MTLCYKAEFKSLILYRSILFFIFVIIINGFILYHLLLVFPQCNENMKEGGGKGRECVGEEGAFFVGKRLFSDHLPL